MFIWGTIHLVCFFIIITVDVVMIFIFIDFYFGETLQHNVER